MRILFELLVLIGLVGLIFALGLLVFIKRFERHTKWRNRLLGDPEATVAALLSSIEIPSIVLAQSRREIALSEIRDAMNRIRRVRELTASRDKLWASTMDALELSVASMNEAIYYSNEEMESQAHRIARATVTFKASLETALRLKSGGSKPSA